MESQYAILQLQLHHVNGLIEFINNARNTDICISSKGNLSELTKWVNSSGLKIHDTDLMEFYANTDLSNFETLKNQLKELRTLAFKGNYNWKETSTVIYTTVHNTEANRECDITGSCTIGNIVTEQGIGNNKVATNIESKMKINDILTILFSDNDNQNCSGEIMNDNSELII
jgi:hypothetical protein